MGATSTIAQLNELVLDCYRLARWYHQPPNVFLDMPMSEVRTHMDRTIEIKRLMESASESDDG